MYQGDENQALLNYHECAQIFDQLHNIEKKGRCYNNLGCIYLKKGQFKESKNFLEAAISIQKDIEQSSKSKYNVKP